MLTCPVATIRQRCGPEVGGERYTFGIHWNEPDVVDRLAAVGEGTPRWNRVKARFLVGSPCALGSAKLAHPSAGRIEGEWMRGLSIDGIYTVRACVAELGLGPGDPINITIEIEDDS